MYPLTSVCINVSITLSVQKYKHFLTLGVFTARKLEVLCVLPMMSLYFAPCSVQGNLGCYRIGEEFEANENVSSLTLGPRRFASLSLLWPLSGGDWQLCLAQCRNGNSWHFMICTWQKHYRDQQCSDLEFPAHGEGYRVLCELLTKHLACPAPFFSFKTTGSREQTSRRAHMSLSTNVWKLLQRILVRRTVFYLVRDH